MDRAILDEYGTPNTFWGEAQHTTLNILNKVHVRMNSHKTLYELLYEEETNEEAEEDTSDKEKAPSRYVQRNHLETQILGEKESDVQTRRALVGYPSYLALLSTIEPKNLNKSSEYESWVKAMDKELDQIEKNDTWELVPRPHDKNVIGTKWIFKNKLNENGEVIRKNARLVCKGYAQQEGTDFKETFAPVATLEAI
eukprot:PITA_21764